MSSFQDILTEAPLRVKPANVKLNHDGFVLRDIVVRLPEKVIADDLKRPDLWKDVQRSALSLRRLDRLLIIAWDETWLAEAFVEQAGPEDVYLAKPRVTRMAQRADNLLNDGTYAVRWNGAGYHVERLRDDVKVSETFSNIVLAEKALIGMYPRRA